MNQIWDSLVKKLTEAFKIAQTPKFCPIWSHWINRQRTCARVLPTVCCKSSGSHFSLQKKIEGGSRKRNCPDFLIFLDSKDIRSNSGAIKKH